MTADEPVPRWIKLGTEPMYAGYVRVRRDQYRLPDGSESGWDVIEIGDTVSVVAFTPDDRVVLFDQYRVGPERVIAELPGGLIDPGEDAVEAGIRELQEETGYRPGAVFHAGAEWAAANSRRRKNILIAADCVRVAEPQWEAGETGRVREILAAALLEHLVSGELSDAGAALRGLHAFARAGDVPAPLAGLQRSVRTLLAPWTA
ncbi:MULTISPECIES: NUDIX hydrolase [Microbacterium]|uniref:ADP-ribose pyrophosphatase n=1 Tax=Microbacterium saccharophilum TaxID=1213358 RepID=A0A7Z7CWL3_9MICO|nr:MULTISPECIES: NUDIX hydrolase [Microbacterium]SFI33427.1 ADP-ribose pyrophosphatase [Microbacterium saccharophilum]